MGDIFATLLKLGGIPAVMIIIKTIGLPAIVTTILNWDFIPRKQADGTTKKVDIVEIVKAPALKPFVASFVAGLLYLGWNTITGEVFDMSKLTTLLGQVSGDGAVSGAFSVLFYNVYTGLKEKKA